MMKKTKKKKVVKTLLLCLKAYSTEFLSIRVTQLLHFVTSQRRTLRRRHHTLPLLFVYWKKHSTHKLMTSQETGPQTHDISC